MKSIGQEYYALMGALAATVGSLIAEGLGLRADYFKDYFTDEIAHCRLIHYLPPSSPETPPVGAGEHTDWGLITLLLQDDVGGLQVQDRESKMWIDVPPTKGAYVVNVGDLLSRFTNDVYVSARHRVVAPPQGTHRYSVPYFSDGK